MNFLDVILVAVIIFMVLKSTSKVDYRVFDRNSTAVMRGVVMIGIILHHVHNNLQLSSPILGQVGYLGTALFFFISGYGNHISLNKNNSELKWLLKKVLKIYIPFLISYVIYYLVLLIGYHDILPSLNELANDLVTVSLPNQVSWFPKIILVCFLFHWVIRRLFSKESSQVMVLCISILCMVIALWKLGFPSYWFNSVLCYPIGAIVNEKKEKFITIMNEHKYSFLGILVFLFVASFLAAHKFWFISVITAVLFCAVCFAYTCCFVIEEKWLSWIGNNSFEFYLFHIVCLQCFLYLVPSHPIVYTFCVMLFSVLIVILYKKCCYRAYIQ